MGFFFTFKGLPFVLSSACFCFTKLLRPLVKRWDSMSHCCFVYLDDGFSGLPESVSAIAATWVQFFQGFSRRKKKVQGVLLKFG